MIVSLRTWKKAKPTEKDNAHGDLTKKKRAWGDGGQTGSQSRQRDHKWKTSMVTPQKKRSDNRERRDNADGGMTNK